MSQAGAATNPYTVPGSRVGGAGATAWGRRQGGRVRSWVMTPEGGVALLILTSLTARLVFAASLGLGIDESYMVAAGRDLQLSYYDHPPLAWWLPWAMAHLFGTDAAWVVRLPFVVLFAGTTWLMFALTRRFFGPCAGLWAAATMNAAPVIGVTSASWVLPDGPLLAALLGAACCFVAALSSSNRAAWIWWLGTGLCAGLGLLSKYSAALTMFGAVLFLATEPGARAWLRRPHPYVAGLAALAVFSPVLVWNAEHNWVSLLFQGGRAGIGRLHPFGPLSTFAGESLFLLPWMWLPLVILGVAALRAGPRNPERWLLACLALPPIAVFAVISLWSHVLFHWATPGYLMLFPLLGDAVGRHRRRNWVVRAWLVASAATVVLGSSLVGTEVYFNWLPDVIEDFAFGTDPDLGAVDWASLPKELGERGLMRRPGLVIAATRWFDAGKADYALGGRMRVMCLGTDPRQYSLIAKQADFLGDDVLVLAPRMSIEDVDRQFGTLFDRIEQLAPILVLHDGRPAMLIPVFLGHRLHRTAAQNPGVTPPAS